MISSDMICDVSCGFKIKLFLFVKDVFHFFTDELITLFY